MWFHRRGVAYHVSTGVVFPTTREAPIEENARKWEWERRLVKTLLAEAEFLWRNEQDTDIFARLSHMTRRNGCGGVFLLYYSHGKCSYAWMGAWRSRCGCLKVWTAACHRAEGAVNTPGNVQARAHLQICGFTKLGISKWIRLVRDVEKKVRDVFLFIFYLGGQSILLKVISYFLLNSVVYFSVIISNLLHFCSQSTSSTLITLRPDNRPLPVPKTKH